MADDFDMPVWLIEIAIEPKSKGDQEKLGVALEKLTAEDPLFRVTTDLESGQTILRMRSSTRAQHANMVVVRY